MDVQAWMDQCDAAVTAAIRRFGWHISYVGGACSCPRCSNVDDGPTFAYTVGMFGLGHPELLIFSVTPETALAVINQLGDRIVRGETLLPGFETIVDGFEPRIVPEVVPNAGEIVFDANLFYDRPPGFSVPLLQLTYADAADRFPWEAEYAGPHQPRPGTFSA